ncbi:type VII secretion-associated protein [Mycolicibacterium sp. GF69]|uniref:type VII secretion-associated protein n=1 Tax=Mycolicibacterium sp. GF69 TaxID=2267251 RepID=UPI001057F34F|nr:type VII secretion-associated protein [Mycolicibacterium sp. GF69]
MTPVVIEVGPITIRGPNPLDPELVSAALESVDDDFALFAEQAISVPELWTKLMQSAVNDTDAVVLVCPTWWPSARIDRIRNALAPRSVDTIGRTAVLQRQTSASVVEIAPEMVVVTRVGARAVVIADDDAALAEKVAAAVGLEGPVLIDAPGAGPLAQAVAKRLWTNGIQGRVIEEDAVLRAAGRQVPSGDAVTGRQRNTSRRAAVVTVVVALTAAVWGLAGLRGSAAEPSTSALLVEGRVRVAVPAAWPVKRITSGPGSARAQLVSPSDDNLALHLTQSVGPPQESLTEVAASLRNALVDEPGDVFVDFDASDTSAGRPGVTYRELRRDHHVAWTVLVEDGVRIAIGCQSAPGRESTVREICDQAIQSAHVVS